MRTREKSEKFDAAVIGGGLAGATATLALAKAGVKTIQFAPEAQGKDTRTTAFLWQTVAFFEQLEVWETLKKDAFPLETMRIVDGTSRLFRAGQTEFSAAEIDLEAFGYNLVNWQVLETLQGRISGLENVEVVHKPVSAIEANNGRYTVTTGSGNAVKHDCGFLVGADGRNSMVRETFIPGVSDWAYPQEAIVLDFEHEYPSQRTSTEFHTDSGPFTVVPQSDRKAGLVWMEHPDRVREILALDRVGLERLLEEKMQSFLGKVTLANEPRSFPIKGLVAKSFGEGNVVLVGEAAHVFPPIGAQGFNLGVRDIESMIEVMTRHTNTENRGTRYHTLRSADIRSRTMGVDLLNRSLLSGFLPTQLARALGLYVLGNFAPLRKMVMKQGISPVH
ncbi:MAG: FAD-dependent monooxygenase, partial [Pseudomonadota bacterium]